MTVTEWESTCQPSAVVGGADTHADTFHLAAIDGLGRDLGDREFPATPSGYGDALAFLSHFGVPVMIGIEGTSSYGAGFARAARVAGIEVREVTRPGRAHRRRRGKSDPIDAYQAARAVLAGHADAAVKDEQIEAIRALHNARNSAVKARTAAMNQIHQLLITAPVAVREQYRGFKSERLIDALVVCQPATQDRLVRAVLTALRTLARRHQFLTDQADDLEVQLRDLVTLANPSLLAAKGVGPVSAAQLLITAGGNPDRLRNQASFAALCRTAPVPGSSCKTSRHRLARGGDRAANSALHTIAVSRLRHDPRTRAFATAQNQGARGS